MITLTKTEAKKITKILKANFPDKTTREIAICLEMYVTELNVKTLVEL